MACTPTILLLILLARWDNAETSLSNVNLGFRLLLLSLPGSFKLVYPVYKFSPTLTKVCLVSRFIPDANLISYSEQRQYLDMLSSVSSASRTLFFQGFTIRYQTSSAQWSMPSTITDFPPHHRKICGLALDRS